MVAPNGLVLAASIPGLGVHFYRHGSPSVDGAFPGYAPSAGIAAHVV